jgi:antitoxin MazE
MKTRLVRIGNTQGVRIPKPLLEQTGLRDEVDIEVEGDHLVIRAVAAPRAGWDEAFQEMARQGDDALLDSDARWVLDDPERMELTGADSEAFLDALLNPPEPTEALVEAFRRHREALDEPSQELAQQKL